MTRLFVEALGKMYEGCSFEFVSSGESMDVDADELDIPVATFHQGFGRLRVHPKPTEATAVTAIRNLTGMLAVLLENRAQRTELKLRAERTEALLARVVKHLPVLVYVYDLDGETTVYANLGSAEDLPQAVAPPHFSGEVHPEDRGIVSDHRESLALAVPGEVARVEFRAGGDDGEERWYLSHDTVMEESEAGRRLVIGSCIDITERKRHQDELARMVGQRDLLIRELHHRVKNNMQVTRSLFSLQEDRSASTRVSEIFSQARARIEAMALVHEQLHHSHVLGSLSLRPYLEELLAELRTSFLGRGGRWSISLHCDDLTVDLDRAVPVGLIFTELVSNSFKYVDVPEPALTVTITGTYAPDGLAYARLVIADNGAGIPAPAQPDAATESASGTGAARDGLGLTLVHNLAGQIHGRARLLPRDGTCWEIEFPLS